MRGSQLPIAEQLPYSAGPGMPGPYGTAAIKKRLFSKQKARSLFAGENALNLC